MNQPLVDEPLWYKDAVIYQAHVRAFFDSNDDGVGDFQGLTRRLDYIQSLGVNTLWIQPFYPSPLRDDGYDIAHYEGVHPSYGTLRDFKTFLDAAHARGLRVITELVINHTSDQHPWFQAARRAKPGTSKRNYYVWSDHDTKYSGVRIIFSDAERSNWTWDHTAGQYYWHRFFHHQPDLNFDNPRVRRAVAKVMRFWLDHGVDGMRLDAVPYLIEREGTSCANLPETHDILRELRREMDARHPGRMLLAEANLWPSDVAAYFGDNDECHMAFHFPLMPRLFMALRQEDRHPISEILYQTPDIPSACQWAIFLRNHDELTLEMVTDEERDYMYQTYAADPQMRVNAGIRRRLAPLMENSRRRIELMHGLLLSLPGTPTIYYGDEIGMGDNVYLGDRNGVRTPMQWTADRNAGFSRTDPARLYAPVIMDPVFGYQSVNVEAQERSPFSLLHWMRRFITLRQRNKAFGRGSIELMRPENRRIFAFIRKLDSGDPILVVANLARTMQPATLDLSKHAGLVPVELSGGTELPRITDQPYFMTLSPYAFYWLQLQRQPAAPVTIRAIAPVAEEAVDALPLLLGPDWGRTLSGATRQLLERNYLAPFLRRQRWFTQAGEVQRVQIVDWGTLHDGEQPLLVTLLTVRFAGGREDQYVVPMVLTSGDRAAEVVRQQPEAIVAHVAGARRGLLHGALDAATVRELFSLIADARTIALRHGVLHGLREPAFASVRGQAGDVDLTPVLPATDRANTSVRLAERFHFKVVRRVEPGVSQEVEIGRFLTEGELFPRVPLLTGTIEYRPGTGSPLFATTASTVAVLHSFVPHQMDGWRQALGELGRYLEAATTWEEADALLPAGLDLWTSPIPERARATIGAYLESAATLGRRTAELHHALTSDAAERSLGTSVLDEPWRAAFAANFHGAAAAVLDIVEGIPTGSAAKPFAALAPTREKLAAKIDALVAALPAGIQLSRVHGAYDLEQVLLSEGDFKIIDFEGDPARSLQERKQHDSPMRDVASMARSFHYAASFEFSARAALTPQDRGRLAVWADWWRTWVTASFLQGWRGAAAGAAFLPSELEATHLLFDALRLRKVLSEIRHEAARRPEHLWIPLEILAVIAD